MTTLRTLLTTPIRLPHLTPYVPKPDDPAVFWFNSERDDIVREVTQRLVAQAGEDRRRLELALNDIAYNEMRRLETQRDDEAREALPFWRGLVKRIAKLSDDEKREAFRKICERLGYDIAGNFDPRVYRMATTLVPRLLEGALNPPSLPQTLLGLEPGKIERLVMVEGAAEKVRTLSKLGTVVFVPTHSSNLDSVVMGHGIERIGVPPVVYGAGKNLFTNPIISFFMHNLGAYRVDRRIRANLYKDALKTYSTVMIERGYHSLFFPGGTRSRSGMIEQHLKLGLAGSAVEAFARNRVRAVNRPVFFVPTTINYALVLEAETLIEDYLKDAGKSRFIIDDDEFSRVDRWVEFFKKITQMQGACILRFGDPIDPFANPVDDAGQSIAPNGRIIDPSSYVLRDGKPVLDPKRDAAYTRELGHVLAERYRRDTVVMSTQLVAHVLFRHLVRATPRVDLFGRLRHRGDVSVPFAELVQDVGETRDRILALEARGEVHASGVCRYESPAELVDRALNAWQGYHTKIGARRDGDDVVIEDPMLLLYYQNRLVLFATRIASEAQMDAAREIAALGERP